MTGRFIGLGIRKYRRSAEAHHADYRARSGSDQIASPFALAVLRATLEIVQPARVLEVGSGIGTMTALITSFGCEVYEVEDIALCRAALRRNLADWQVRRLSPGLGYLHSLIVVDGEQIRPNIALGLLKRGGWMLVEGNRRPFRAGLKYGYRDFVTVNLRPFDRSKGVWLLAFEPTPRLRLAFALERGWQRVLDFTSRAWSVLTGATHYHGKRRVYDSVAR
jgi:hypothetical protein